MIVEFPTGKKIEDNGKCDNCKYNCGYKVRNPNELWCDKKLKNVNKYDSCEDYFFRLAEKK